MISHSVSFTTLRKILAHLFSSLKGNSIYSETNIAKLNSVVQSFQSSKVRPCLMEEHLEVIKNFKDLIHFWENKIVFTSICFIVQITQ